MTTYSDGIDDPTRSLLIVALEAAVPMWIERLRDRPIEYLLERAQVCGQHIAERGDVLQFKSKKTEGASGEAFNRCAEGLACLALVAKGGVTFEGAGFGRSERGFHFKPLKRGHDLGSWTQSSRSRLGRAAGGSAMGRDAGVRRHRAAAGRAAPSWNSSRNRIQPAWVRR